MYDAELDTTAEAGFRLSPPQLLAWPHAAGRRVQARILVEGPVAPDQLEQALLKVMERHESLRTRLVDVPGLSAPLQSVEDAPELAWCEERLPGDAAAAGASIDSAAAADLDEPWTGTVRARLLSGADGAVLLVTADGMFADRRSLVVVLEEMASVLGGTGSPETPLQYLDAAEWLNEQLATDEARSRMDGWLARELVVADGVRLPSESGPAGEPTRLVTELEPALVAAVDRTSGELGAGTAAVLLGAWQLLLGRLTGQEEIVTAVRSDTRGMDELDDVVGPFETGVPVLGALSGALPFASLVRELDRALAAVPAGQFAFDGTRVAEPVPFGFAFTALPAGVRVGGVRLSMTGLLAGPGGLALDLGAARTADGRLVVSLARNEQQVSHRHVQVMADQYLSVLRAVVSHPHARLGDLGLADDPETAGFPGLRAAAGASATGPALAHLRFERRAAERPEALAVICGEDALTYREAETRANRLACALRARGVGPDVPVGLVLERSVDYVVGLLAVLKAGGAFVPVDPGLPAARVRAMLDELRPAVLVTHRGLLDPEVVGTTSVLDLDRDAAMLGGLPDTPVEPAVRPEHTAYVIFTSGSTGRAKGVAVPHRAICAYVDGVLPTLALPEDELLGTLATPAADLGHTAVFGALCTGRSLFLARPEEVLDGEALGARFRDRPLGLLKVVPSHLAALLDAPGAEALLPSRCLVLGGEPLPEALLERIRALRPGLRVVNHYGPTESAVGALVHEVGQDERGPVPIGRPLPGYRAYVLDAGLRPVLRGAAGELYLAGPGLARGYHGSPRTTAERFLPDPFGPEPGARMYRTGDLVRLRPDGAAVFLGRTDHQVKIRGHRVELGEIESELRRDENVADAVVVADADGTRLTAFVAARRGCSVDTDGLRQRLSLRLPEYMVPAAIAALPALPLSPNGKVDRGALPTVDADASRSARYVAPATETEVLLAGLWADVLGRERVGRDNSFFQELGGNSLDATRVVARIRAATGVGLHVSALFEAPTVASLAELVDRSAADAGTEAIVPAERTGPMPLSYAQRRLWVLSEVDGVRAAYNIPAAIRIRGDLEPDLLVRALREVVHRHEALRTNIVLVDETPWQVVREPAEFAVPTRETAEADVPERALAFASRPFDLERDELFRAELLRVGPQEHVLLLCLHHIVSDGWSTALLWRETVTLYSDHRAGRVPALAPLPIQYADYAVWQTGWLHDGGMTPQLDYWTQQLRDLPAALELPTDRPRPKVQGYDGASVPIEIGPETVAGLRALSHEHRSTVFMVLLAAFNVLLARHSGQQDIAVGTPVANRTRAEVENLIGCFFNTLVIRTDLSGDPDFAELLGRVREAVLGGQAHQELPFERLVEALNPPRDAGRSPLFQALFVYQPAPDEGLTMGGLQLDPLSIGGDVAKYDLTLDLTEHAHGVSGRIEYRTDLFDAETVQRLGRQFLELLDSVVRTPQARLGELTLLPDSERDLLLRGWNAGYRGRPEAPRAADAFEEQVRRAPEATALVHGNRSLSYGELDRAANRLAHVLRSEGAVGNELVGLWLDRSVEMVVAMLAVLKAGAAYLPLDPAAPTARNQDLIADARLGFVITTRERSADLPPGVIPVDPVQDTGEDSAPVRRSGSDDLAYIIYTSGSTGRPKGVMVGQQNLAGFFAAMDEQLGGDQPGTWLAVTRYTFDISVLELLWTLTRGFKVVLADDELVLSAGRPGPRRRTPDFSLFYFASDAGDREPDKYRLLLEGAQWADRHGFAAVWTPERHFGTFGGLYPNPVVTSAALATVTSRIGLRTGSLVLPLHDPIRVAEDWAVVDNISVGRVGLSVASGWQPHDFALAPGNFADRKEIMFRDLEVVRRLWRGETVRTVSGTGEEIEVRTLPRPVQSELPVWVTAAGNPETFRRAGAVGANVLTHLLGQSVEELAEAVRVYRTARAEAGHIGSGHVTLMVHTFVSQDDDVRRTVREPFKNYLRESVDLVRPFARARGLELEDFDEGDLDALLDHAFQRYYETSGLFGTPDGCVAMVDRLSEVGVDEIACLVDFGVPADEVLAALTHLDELRRLAGSAHDEAPRDIAGMIERHGVTHLQCTPSLASVLIADEQVRTGLASLDQMLVGGEALTPVLAENLAQIVGGRLLNVYGPTEATIWSTAHLVHDGGNSIGRPLSNTRVYVLDDRRAPVPIGVPGELHIGGTGVAAGYLHQPELTAERFVTDPFAADPAARMYRTGDVVRYRSNGELEFIGRRDEQVKIHGFRVEPGEIEAALAAAPGVRSAAVVAVDDGRGGQRLIGYVVATGPLDDEALRRHLEERLPRYLVPAQFVGLDAMPLLPSGKTDRRALPEPPSPQRPAQSATAPSTATEQRLAGIWRDLLRCEEIGVGDNFFDLGGDSIVAIQMVSRARQAGIVLTARDLFQYQTLGKLAAAARQGGRTTAEQGVLLGESGLAPIQHWFFEQRLADQHHYNQAVLADVVGDPLDLELLARTRDAVVRHHDALRNTFHPDSAGWIQRTGAPETEGSPIEHVDLSALPAAAWPAELAALQNRAHRALDLDRGPLLTMVSVGYGGRRTDQLFTVIHHTVVDGVSWRILLEDLQHAYRLLRDGRRVELPAKTTSYQEWVGRLAQEAASEQTLAELDYWAGQVEGAHVAHSLPRDRAGDNTEADARTTTAEFTAEETEALLHEVPRAHRADLHAVLLCALAEACVPWTGSRSLLLDMEGHGREELFEDVDVSRSVGWFTALYPLRIDLPAAPAERLASVREQVRRIPRRGIGHGLLRHLHPDASVRSRLAAGRQPEIIFNYLGQADTSHSDDALLALAAGSVGAPHAPTQTRRHLLNVNGIVAGGRLRVDFTFSEAVHDPATIRGLAARFGDLLRRRVEDCRAGLIRLAPSDFPDVELTQESLDDLLGEIRDQEGEPA
ncbi:amino acid adenylation domain-containing protein [Kitasatospora sp. NPDC058218]|uniref:amino acid adenylation domain-containing protein n=1 Tax=Kitasatospora sp. NPDC058218 TaxID=3346385 RepID=UPI0036DE9224